MGGIKFGWVDTGGQIQAGVDGWEEGWTGGFREEGWEQGWMGTWTGGWVDKIGWMGGLSCGAYLNEDVPLFLRSSLVSPLVRSCHLQDKDNLRWKQEKKDNVAQVSLQEKKKNTMMVQTLNRYLWEIWSVCLRQQISLIVISTSWFLLVPFHLPRSAPSVACES